MSNRKKTQSDSDIVVRMYNVGFGDCFLLFVPTDKGIKKVLFDCGTIKAGPSKIGDVVDSVIDDVRDSNHRPRIDVVVMTHRHKDHVSGFESKDWAGVAVGEVWMPWTEDPEDEEAKKIRKKLTRLAVQVERECAAKLRAVSSDDLRRKLTIAQELAVNALSNPKAMQTLHHGFAGNPLRRFLPLRNATKKWIETEVLPGVIIHILGPSFDENIIKMMDPPAGESYLKLFDSSNDDDRTAPTPFSREWRLSVMEYRRQYKHFEKRLMNTELETIKKIGENPEFDAAVTLDQAINGTSLMLVLEYRNTALLFSGDAQWGTWRQVLGNEDFRTLLGKIDFYKVGHHGSHNATPVQFVERVMPERIKAMISVTPHEKYPRIPKLELLEAMEGKSAKVSRSDRPDEMPRGQFSQLADRAIETVIPI